MRCPWRDWLGRNQAPASEENHRGNAIRTNKERLPSGLLQILHPSRSVLSELESSLAGGEGGDKKATFFLPETEVACSVREGHSLHTDMILKWYGV